MTGAFGYAELDEAIRMRWEKVEAMRVSGDWAAYVDDFTDDVEYVEHAFGTMHGKDEVRAWVVKTMSTFPGRIMTGFPIAWKVIDSGTGRIVCEIRNPMPDPGDGTVFDEPNVTILDYAGDGKWSRQEDVYNPLRFHAMTKQWAAIAAAHDRLPEDAARYI
jgi:hypothetical protein